MPRVIAKQTGYSARGLRLNNWMMRASLVLSFVPALVLHCSSQQRTAGVPSQQDTVKVIVQGDSSRLPDFVESCRKEFSEHGMTLQLVKLDESYEYNIVLAQESSISGAAAAVIVLDSRGQFIASVVRSGRWSGKGAFNASAKELAKKLAVLRNH
jgi:hypothetical protein